MVQSSFQLHLLEKKQRSNNNRHLENFYRNLKIDKCDNKSL